MNKIAFAMLVTLSFSAYAADEGVVIDNKKILLTDVSVSGGSDGRTFKAADLTKGVHVKVAKMFYGKRYPNAEALVKERLTAKGIKIAEQEDGASLALMFDIGGSMDMESAEAKADYSSLPSTSKVAANAGAVAGAVVSFGTGGAAAAAVGFLFPVDSKSLINAMVLVEPKKTKGFLGEGLNSSVKNGTFTNGVSVSYKLEKDHEAPDDVVLKMLIDQWVSKYISNDSTQPQSIDSTKGASK